MNVPNLGDGPWDTFSQLSQPSSAGNPSYCSPLKPNDLGIPTTPEGRVLKPIDEAAIDEGYDSDGLRAPWEDDNKVIFDAPEEEEAPLPFGPSPFPSVEPLPKIDAPKSITTAEVPKLLVSDMKKELKKRGLDTRGKKNELATRLIDAITRGVPLKVDLTSSKAENLAGDSFTPGAHWEELPCDGDFIVESQKEGFRYPTVPTGEVSAVKKRNYSQKFDRMVFPGLAEIPVRWKNGKIARHKRTGEVQYKKQPHSETAVNMEWARKHKLDLDSHPVHWFQAFIPHKKRNDDDFCIENLLTWTNMRAWLDNAALGGKYSDFKNFTVDDIMKHIGLYLFQGLSPSPQVDMKFHPQGQDPVNGNDFICASFGGNVSASKRRHRHFKSFFTSCNPRRPIPSRTTHPNWKVHPFLKHILEVSKEAACLGRNLSIDEQTIGFQGHHKDKQRITYKKEGDGFLADALCSDGYTYAFHFRHQPASEKIMKTYKCSPLHARVLGLISQLPHKYYTLGMDNLYMSAKLCRLAYGLDQRVMIHGVTRPSLRGIPPAIKQNEVTRKGDLEKVRHTVKAAVLKGDEVCKGLVAISLYDTKPVYFLTNACEGITWTQKGKKVYDTKEKKTCKMPFYRLNVIDFYNHNMGNVDLADQLRNVYRYDTSWHRNRKWWWSIWWWGFQLLLTNAYVLYKKFHLLHSSKAAVSHYDFIKQVALAWINKERYWPKTIKLADTTKRKSTDDSTNIQTRARRLQIEDDASSQRSICRMVKDDRLDPINGLLKMRMNYSVQHYPENSTAKKPKCALHNWARGRNGAVVTSRVVLCSVCQVHLCITYFNTFHKEANIVGKKKQIADS